MGTTWYCLFMSMGFPGGAVAKNLPGMETHATQVPSLCGEDPPEQGMAIFNS